MTFYEVVNQTRSSQYEFMFCEIHLGADGRGEGKLSTVAKMRWLEPQNTLEIEDYAIQPLRLTQVWVEK
jgi:hypothetical protein